jgi:hypothetical protein
MMIEILIPDFILRSLLILSLILSSDPGFLRFWYCGLFYYWEISITDFWVQYQLIDWSVEFADRAHNCDEENTVIRDQIMMLIDSWSMIYVFLIYVSMKKQASKQTKKSICEWDDFRSGQAQYRIFVSSLNDVRSSRDKKLLHNLRKRSISN